MAVAGGSWRVALTLFVAPRTNRIFYDEQIYQSIGQNLADLKLAQMCNDGSVEYGRLQCASGEYNKQPYAYPHAAEPGLPRSSACMPATAFAVNAAAMAADGVRRVPAGLAAVPRSRRGTVRRSAARAHAAAAHLVGDGRRRAVRVAGRGAGPAVLRRITARTGGAAALAACVGRCGVCHSVPAGVAPDPAGHRRCWPGRGCAAS